MTGVIKAYVIGGDTAVAAFLDESPLILPVLSITNLNEVDMLVFTGGADVNPYYYGEKNKYASWLNPERDQQEFDLFWRTRDTHYHFGICRGLQLLAVGNGCPLWQNVTGHELHGVHNMLPIYGQWKGKKIPGVTSVHHQAVRVCRDYIDNVLAYENLGQSVRAMSAHVECNLDRVVESMWFPDTNSFGIQGHPEYHGASKEYKEYIFHHLLEDPETGYYANMPIGAKQCAG